MDPTMDEENHELPQSHFAERPIECSECRKPIAVRYTEVVGKNITHTIMCNDCPQLQHRLHGLPIVSQQTPQGTELGLCCGECGTTLDAIKMGSNLGCNHCYEVFDDILIKELRDAKKVSRHVASAKPPSHYHMGRAPGESKEMSASLRLLALNEALNETLSREDYEQAAWLRDQIKAIEENHSGDKKE
ncbi:MAG: UvrB/UvrC motif-containing protein [Chlamydiales bacterium]